MILDKNGCIHGYAYGSDRATAIKQNKAVCEKAAALVRSGQLTKLFLVGGLFFGSQDPLMWHTHRNLLLGLGISEEALVVPSLRLQNFRPPSDTFEETWMLGELFNELYPDIHPSMIAFYSLAMDYHSERVCMVNAIHNAWCKEIFAVSLGFMPQRLVYDFGATALPILDPYGVGRVLTHMRLERAMSHGLHNMLPLTNAVWFRNRP